eukprot:TRINITY_DN14516_c2_g1_i1.p1 TRINITY_DN14516_c2_g1~~TRINITY_DN14516_c2_g1_i1.p1  ORF type:complete len:362 (-),score=34.27 TRINITY_DN14516_c2_g1_i1:422-1507(-)
MAMLTKSPYEILGVDILATSEEIRHAYKQKAVVLHPDKNLGKPEAKQAFCELKAAEELLLDAGRRAAYHESSPDAIVTEFIDSRLTFQAMVDLRPYFAEMEAKYGISLRVILGASGHIVVYFGRRCVVEEAWAEIRRLALNGVPYTQSADASHAPDDTPSVPKSSASDVRRDVGETALRKRPAAAAAAATCSTGPARRGRYVWFLKRDKTYGGKKKHPSGKHIHFFSGVKSLAHANKLASEIARCGDDLHAARLAVAAKARALGILDKVTTPRYGKTRVLVQGLTGTKSRKKYRCQIYVAIGKKRLRLFNGMLAPGLSARLRENTAKLRAIHPQASAVTFRKHFLSMIQQDFPDIVGGVLK